jgi:hypothetical protein
MPRGTTLRLPYSLTVTNQGELGLAVVDQGSLSASITHTGNLRVAVYNPKNDNTIYGGGDEVAEITAYEGDFGYDLQFTITDVDGNAFNLSGSTVKFKMASANATTLKIDGSCTITDASAGECAYTTVAADFDTAGEYEAEIEITFSASKIYTIGNIQVHVLRDLPRCTA